jgi:anti-sigma factor RsiW
MERQIIERLAIDHALGELDADTAALFEAYLAEHAEARPWAQAMAQTCTQTREAIRQKTQPTDEHPRLDRTGTPWPRTIPWQTYGRWAAVILVSLAIGAAVGQRFRAPVSTPKTVVLRAQSTAEPQGWRQILSKPERGFWETKAVAMLQPKTNEIPSTHPGRRGLWDRYRQQRKGRSYE